MRKVQPVSGSLSGAQAFRSFLRMERSLSDGATLTVTPYLRSNDMEFLMHFLPGQAVEENEHTSIGAQISYARNSDRVSYVVGLDSELTNGELTEIQTQTATPFFHTFNIWSALIMIMKWTQRPLRLTYTLFGI